MAAKAHDGRTGHRDHGIVATVKTPSRFDCPKRQGSKYRDGSENRRDDVIVHREGRHQTEHSLRERNALLKVIGETKNPKLMARALEVLAEVSSKP